MVLSLLHFISVQFLFWATGAVLIKRCISGSLIFSLKQPHWYSSYFLGLVINCIAAFIANQFLGYNILPIHQCLLSGFLFAIIYFFARPSLSKPSFHLDFNVKRGVWYTIILMIVVFVFLRRHLPMLCEPLSDWDAFLYHLPLGSIINQGNFPSPLGRSFTLQMQSAFPPLFFYVYGLNMWVADGRFIYLAPKITLIFYNLFICFSIYYFGKSILHLKEIYALLSVLCVCFMISVIPNIQSATTLYFILALIYTYRWIEYNSQQEPVLPAIIAAVLCGGCYWSHYIGLALAGFLFLGVFISLMMKKERESILNISPKSLLIFVVMILLIISPHMIRNLIAVGNPLYPIFLQFIGGEGVTQWFIENRLAGILPHVDINYFAVNLSQDMPLTSILIGGIFSLVLTNGLRNFVRTSILVVVVGYFFTWFYLLHGAGPQAAPIYRYLFPVATIIPCFMFVHIQDTGERPNVTQLLGITSLVSIVIWVVAVKILNVGDDTSKLILIAMCVFYLVFIPIIKIIFKKSADKVGAVIHVDAWRRCVIVIMMTACAIYICNRPLEYKNMVFLLIHGFLTSSLFTFIYIFSVIVYRKGIFKPQLDVVRALVIFSVLFSSFLIHKIGYNHLIEYSLPIQTDLEWINNNLPKNAIILMGETRLFTLKRDYIPADDYRIEDLYKTNSIDSSLITLRKNGITHIYFTGTNEIWPPYATIIQEMTMSKEWKPFIRKIYKNNESSVYEIVAF